MKPSRALKLAFVCSLLFATHSYSLRLGWVLRDTEVAMQKSAVKALEQEAEGLKFENEFWQRRAKAAQNTLIRNRRRIVEVSAYTASQRECDADPHIAASMQPPSPGTVAVSRDLFDMGWTFGKKIYLKGLGPYIINDVMNQRYQMRVDVFIDHKRAAMEFGVRTTEAILG